jgi:2-dehydro-3-deoxygluconokinase
VTTPGGFDALCVGETMVMVTPATGGRLTGESQYLLRPGGAESNVAIHLAALGHRVAWASQLGADPLGDLVLEEVARNQVDTSLVVRLADAPTGVYFKDPAPQGTAVYYYRTGSAASRMSARSVDSWAERRTRVLHLSGITAALSEDCHQLMAHVIHDRPISGTVSFDVNYRPKLATDRTAETLLTLARGSDVVFVGRDEAEALWNTSTAEEIRDLLPEPAHLVVKDGPIEAVSFSAQGTVRVPSPLVDVLEPVGAGDAFAAGWLSGFLSGRGAEYSLNLGHYVASRVLTSPTDHAQLGSRAEIETILKRPTSDW